MEASALVSDIVRGAQQRRMQGVRMVMERASEFPSTLQAQLTGIALDPAARDFANGQIDRNFEGNRSILSLPRVSPVPEVVIGSGFHAATYAATRVLAGKPAPWILERAPFTGGAFAIRSEDGTYPGVFNLNSRNRRGTPGLSGDNEAQLNYLPGAPIQASALSNAEYQTNADIAFVTRLTLAQYAPRSVFPGVEVKAVETNGDTFDVVYLRNGIERRLVTPRIIDARGLGDARGAGAADGKAVMTFAQFLQRMTQPWPLRGLRNVAVIGGGDSGKCAVESLFGLGPNPFMAAAELDSVNRVDWYGQEIASSYESYCSENRGRYRAIGRYLRPDKMGSARLKVFNTRRDPIALPGGPALVNGRSYDMVIVATGNQVTGIPGLEYPYAESVYTPGDFNRAIAVRNESDYGNAVRYRIGPRARIAFDRDEIGSGVASITENSVAMFRLATRTASLAVQLD